MGSSTFAAKLLEAAELLLERGRRSSAFRRRAVSTAYYAVFHAVDKVCSDYVTRSAKRSSDAYLRTYRALDHGWLKNAFNHAPLSDNAKLSLIGKTIEVLQTERHRADYLPPIAGVFTFNRANELVSMAREAVSEIESLKPRNADCRTLALSLLFKERKS